MSDVPGVTGTPGGGNVPAPETLETAEAAAESRQAFDAALAEEASEPPLNESQQPETRTAIKRSLRRLETGAPAAETRGDEAAVEPCGRPASDDPRRPMANLAPESREREAPPPGATRRPAAPTEAAGRPDTPDRAPAVHTTDNAAPVRDAAGAQPAADDTRVTTGAPQQTVAPAMDGARPRTADTPQPSGVPHRGATAATGRTRKPEPPRPGETRESRSPGHTAAQEPAPPDRTARGVAPAAPREPDTSRPESAPVPLSDRAEAGTAQAHDPDQTEVRRPAMPRGDAERPRHTEEARLSDRASSGPAAPSDPTGVATPTQAAASAPTAAPEAVQAPAAHVAEIARQVADRVLVSVPRPGASDEVRITLNRSVLDGSDIRIFREADELRVVFVVQTESAERFLADHRDVLQQTLGDRLRDEHVQVQVETQDRRGAAREDAQGRSRQRYVPQDDSERT